MRQLDWFRWLLLTTVILLAGAAVVLSRGVETSTQELEHVMRYDLAWSGVLGRTEAAELEKRVIVLAQTRDQSTREAASIAYQILQGRLDTWGSGDFGELLDRNPAMQTHFDSLVSAAESLGELLGNLGDDAAAARAVDRAGEVKHLVDRIGMKAHTLSVNEMTRVRNDLRGKQHIQKLLIVFLFLVVLALLLLMSWQNRSLARANAAIGESARRLAEGERRLSGVLGSTTDCVVVLDPDWRVTFANKSASDLIFPDADFLGIPIWDFYPDLEGSEVYRIYETAMAQQTAVELETYLAPWDAWFEIHACPTPENLTIFFRDVTERRRLSDELGRQARHDPLTDLANRTLFAERLEAGLPGGRRQRELSLILIDLDDFKGVNDSLGHQAGDDLLRQLAGRLTGLVRKEDTVARLGGDEFAIIQPGPVDPLGAAEIARRIAAAMRAPFDVEGADVALGVSIGIAVAPGHGTCPDELIRRADLALYRAKEAKGTGLNHCVFEPEMEERPRPPRTGRPDSHTASTGAGSASAGPDRRKERRTVAASESGGRAAPPDAAELSLQNARMMAALDHMSQGLCMFDADKRLVVCNERYASMYGIPLEDMRPGTPFQQIVQNRIDNGQFPFGDPDAYMRERMAAVEERKRSLKVQHATDGRAIAISHCPLEDGGWVATHDDITDIQRFEARIAHLARYDTLTDLPNRASFRAELDQALGRMPDGEHLSVLCVDLDKFKSVNDALGHPTGDDVLHQVAERLRQVAGEGDIIARLGGDEFAILQTGITSPDRTKALAERIMESLDQPYRVEGHDVVVGTSIGIAVAPGDSGDADQLLKLAGMALYRSKLEGQGVYSFFEPEMHARMQARRALEVDLRQAVANDELEVHYQPQVNIETHRVTGFEALLRWTHAGRGEVSPGAFIPLAEEIGLIGQLGAWVLKHACTEAAAWPDDVRLAVNLSPAQFKGRALVGDVMAALEQSGLPAERLELEITETVMLGDTGATLAVLHTLRQLGVRISLDDFGTGYSSLSSLRGFPFDKIKIDRSFVEDLDDQGDALAIVRALLELGRGLGMATTAEGAETMAQIARLRAEGCTEVQGHFFSPARPAAEVPGLLASMAEKSRRAVPVTDLACPVPTAA